VLIGPANTRPNWAAGLATGGNFEICRATRSGDVLTITRAQYGTTARTIVVGDRVYQPIMSHDLTDITDFADHVYVIPDSAEPGVVVTPKTGGKFLDFRWGVEGIQVLSTDPPSPDWFDQVLPATSHTVNDTTTMVYSVEQLLSPIPMMLKINSTAALAAKAVWNANTYPPLTTHYGRFYLYMDVNPGTNLRPIRWLASGTGSPIGFKLRSADRKFEILDGADVAQTLSTGGTFSTQALSAGVHYRIEWKIVHGNPGTVQIKIFTGHSTTALDDFTATYQNGVSPTSVEFGNTAGASLGNKVFRMGAIAGACSDWPGPYAGPPDAFEVGSSSGKFPAAITNDGEIIFRVAFPFAIADGGTGHYMYQKGDIAGRLNGRGLWLGPNFGIGNPYNETDSMSHDISLDLKNRRASFRAMNLRAVNDPPDLEFNRIMLPASAANVNFGAVGSDATWTSGSATVTLPTYQFTLRDRGHGLHLGGTTGGVDGTEYNITEVTGEHTCTVTPIPVTSAAGTGVWKLKTFPYPFLLTGNDAGASLGQFRWAPHAYPFVRKSATGLTSTAGSAVVTVAGFTAADVGRYLLINNDPTIVGNGAGTFIINAIDTPSAGQVTLNSTVTASLSNVPYAVAAAPAEGGGIKPSLDIFTIAGNLTRHMVQVDTTKWVTGMRLDFMVIDPNVVYDTATSNYRSVFSIDANGEILSTIGPLGYGTGAGGSVTQNTSKATTVVLNKANGQITTNAAALAAGANVFFQVTNSVVAATDNVIVTVQSAPTADAYRASVSAVAAGSFRIMLTNITAGSLSQAVVLNFAIINGSIT
jgi:hypothetical protein